MSSKMDLHLYFKHKNPATKKIKLANPDIIVCATENVTPAEIDMVNDEVKTSVRPEKYVQIPERLEINYGIVNSTKATINMFQKRYLKYDFK